MSRSATLKGKSKLRKAKLARLNYSRASGETHMFSRLTKSLGFLAIVLAATLVIPQFTFAQDDRDDDDPPSRAARLSYTGGAVSFEPAGTDDWVTIVNNRPITTGDKLCDDRDGRDELRFGATAVRLGSETGSSFLNLDDRSAQIRVTEGTVNVRVKRLDEDESIEIDTPNLAFTVLRPGSYRVTVNEAGDSTFVKVRGGDGEVTGGGSSYAVHANQTGTFSGTDELSADVQNYYDDDDFDQWCGDRDRRWDRSTSSRYVSDDVVGYEDLDEYGGWRPVPEYGTVWFPHTTIVGWAPYRYGHWVWISPWGWTWVDDAPWGFAPFHYGRWVAVGGVWGWVPCAPRTVVGVAYVRPVYAPALVAWVGGPHFSVGIGIGGGGGVGVAWFPLAPREVYVPSYRVSRTYVTNVNVSNTTVNTTVVNNYYNTVVVNKQVTNIKYVNQTAPNAVTATSRETFTSARPVGRDMMKIDRREIESAQVNPTTPTVAPQQRSVVGAGAPVAARPPARFQERPVVAKTAPPPPPAPFVKQQQEIQATGGRPVGVSQLRRAQVEDTRQAPPNIKIAPPAQPGTPRNVQANQPVGNTPNDPANAQNNHRDMRNDRRDVQNNQSNAQNNQGNMQNNNNRPPSVNNSAPANLPNRPANPPANAGNTPSNSGNAPANPGNVPGNAGNAPGNPRVRNDRPPSSRPADSGRSNNVDPRVDQKQQQQLEQLRLKQDQERQRVEQKQIQEQQRIQQKNPDDARRQQADQRQQQQPLQVDQKQAQEQQRTQQRNAADDARRQQVEQKQQQQLQQLEQKHEQQQQKLEQKQQQERPKDKPANKA